MPSASTSLRRAWPALLLVAGIAMIAAWAVGWTAYQRASQPSHASVSLNDAEKLVASQALNGLSRAELEAKLGKPDDSREGGTLCRYDLGTENSILFGPNRQFLLVHLKADVVNGSTIADD